MKASPRSPYRPSATPSAQGYGLTETCGATCVGLPTSFEHCVGPPQEGACIRLRDWPEGNYRLADASDPAIGMRRGEILIGGPTVCSGYLVDAASPDPEVVTAVTGRYCRYCRYCRYPRCIRYFRCFRCCRYL